MLADNRKEYILRKLEEKSFVRVTELSRDLELSEATVRKLLMQMEEDGLLKRNWGGAVGISGVATEFPYMDKMSKQLNEKRAIAQAAYDLIGDGETVFLDSGTTTVHLARLIARGPKRNIVVCTNALNILLELTKAEDIRTIMIGGEFRHSIYSCVGPLSTLVMGGLAFDKSFVTGSHFTLTRGFSTPELREASTKQSALKMARYRVILMDSDKYGMDSMVIIARPDGVDMLVTDWKIKPEVKEQFEQLGLEVIAAEEERVENG
ncbi:MAG: DeoR/GlpR transcriptional regulator [Lachnospiraceae bacterium]|nr:DeoR/GlpR transcriptional regulator [Lachnospiraceae bacterium]